MNLEKLSLILVVIIGVVAAVAYGTMIVLGLVATFPFGLPILIVIGLFVAICVGVLRQRLSNKEDDFYEKNVKE